MRVGLVEKCGVRAPTLVDCSLVSSACVWLNCAPRSFHSAALRGSEGEGWKKPAVPVGMTPVSVAPTALWRGFLQRLKPVLLRAERWELKLPPPKEWESKQRGSAPFETQGKRLAATGSGALALLASRAEARPLQWMAR